MPDTIKVLLAAIVATIWFAAPASAATWFDAGLEAPFSALLTVGLKCGLVEGKIVCDDKKKSSKNHNDDDDDDDDDHHKGKKKKTGDDDASGLTECTIQGANSGGGCKSGFKYVCEKMKSNKKCCGCVVDKNAKTDPGPNPNYSCCDGFGADGKQGRREIVW